MNIVLPEVYVETDTPYDAMLLHIENAGRTCYQSVNTNGDHESFIKRIIKSGHESVLEHQTITVRVICDRGVTHEIVRHRLAAYSQESTRYCNYSQDKFSNSIKVINIASGFDYNLTDPTDRKKYDLWKDAMMTAEKIYFEMLRLGATPQEARSVLPNSLKTELVMTMNIREWRHFFKMRCAHDAHPQMREVANMIYDEFIKRYPVFFMDIKED
jgi:thymidylate synthase (FAD)